MSVTGGWKLGLGCLIPGAGLALHSADLPVPCGCNPCSLWMTPDREGKL